eukprot:Gregarina_sp_Poly_1__1844@NODE_147_length_12810_cov_168_129012_g132_i0_p1_GENE_NODE_147_length_12810_cov_168_129012_g132_i0NODE_147_length_12810_cov_168_129012_g132_i0_p1_ORF_typecomplete_len1029_score232_93U5_2snRNA_bdg/PF10597_9/1_1e04U5_2snRNA_bdg/PF10597_9/0_11_NODE_147_length_12810_cov_168_129012_g132_i0714710233
MFDTDSDEARSGRTVFKPAAKRGIKKAPPSRAAPPTVPALSPTSPSPSLTAPFPSPPTPSQARSVRSPSPSPPVSPGTSHAASPSARRIGDKSSRPGDRTSRLSLEGARSHIPGTKVEAKMAKFAESKSSSSSSFEILKKLSRSMSVKSKLPAKMAGQKPPPKPGIVTYSSSSSVDISPVPKKKSRTRKSSLAETFPPGLRSMPMSARAVPETETKKTPVPSQRQNYRPVSPSPGPATPRSSAESETFDLRAQLPAKEWGTAKRNVPRLPTRGVDKKDLTKQGGTEKAEGKPEAARPAPRLPIRPKPVAKMKRRTIQLFQPDTGPTDRPGPSAEELSSFFPSPHLQASGAAKKKVKKVALKQRSLEKVAESENSLEINGRQQLPKKAGLPPSLRDAKLPRRPNEKPTPVKPLQSVSLTDDQSESSLDQSGVTRSKRGDVRQDFSQQGVQQHLAKRDPPRRELSQRDIFQSSKREVRQQDISEFGKRDVSQQNTYQPGKQEMSQREISQPIKKESFQRDLPSETGPLQSLRQEYSTNDKMRDPKDGDTAAFRMLKRRLEEAAQPQSVSREPSLPAILPMSPTPLLSSPAMSPSPLPPSSRQLTSSPPFSLSPSLPATPAESISPLVSPKMPLRSRGEKLTLPQMDLEERKSHAARSAPTVVTKSMVDGLVVSQISPRGSRRPEYPQESHESLAGSDAVRNMLSEILENARAVRSAAPKRQTSFGEAATKFSQTVEEVVGRFQKCVAEEHELQQRTVKSKLDEEARMLQELDSKMASQVLAFKTYKLDLEQIVAEEARKANKTNAIQEFELLQQKAKIDALEKKLEATLTMDEAKKLAIRALQKGCAMEILSKVLSKISARIGWQPPTEQRAKAYAFRALFGHTRKHRLLDESLAPKIAAARRLASVIGHTGFRMLQQGWINLRVFHIVGSYLTPAETRLSTNMLDSTAARDQKLRYLLTLPTQNLAESRPFPLNNPAGGHNPLVAVNNTANQRTFLNGCAAAQIYVPPYFHDLPSTVRASVKPQMFARR